MKVHSRLTASALALMLSASTAFATCVSGCPTTPPPAPVPDASFTFSWGGVAQGEGVGLFQGEEGYALVEKNGGVSGDFAFTINSDLCPGGCLEGGLSGTGRVFETVTAEVVALGTTPGQAVSAVNRTTAGGAFVFDYSRTLADPNFD